MTPDAELERIAKEPDNFVEEIEVKPVAGFPSRIVLMCLRADGKVVPLVFADIGAHKVSDELLRAVGALRSARAAARSAG